MVDFPTFKVVDVPTEDSGKKHVIKQNDRKLVLIFDSSFGAMYKEGVLFTSADSDETYVLFDPISERRITLEYRNLRGLLARKQDN
tara:strand:- start:1250 stop:1507 length:258 start_codon:yes stop_codon:yes gene_type:complete